MSYFSTKIIKCVISRVLLLNVEYSYYPFGIFLGGSGHDPPGSLPVDR